MLYFPKMHFYFALRLKGNAKFKKKDTWIIEIDGVYFIEDELEMFQISTQSLDTK